MEFWKDCHEKIEKLTGLDRKKCFSLCTSLSASEKYPLYPKEAIEKKGGKLLGGWGCQGKSNYFPLNIFGDLHTDKPDENDIKNGVEFVKK